MNSASLANLDWGSVALFTLVAAGLVWALIVFLRQNRNDLENLQRTLDIQREEDEKE